ncbi:MAG: hypothetical protein IKS32_13425 [Solobacterium sp.]|nr:hypothetical protein [Solobacterium sp.]
MKKYNGLLLSAILLFNGMNIPVLAEESEEPEAVEEVAEETAGTLTEEEAPAGEETEELTEKEVFVKIVRFDFPEENDFYINEETPTEEEIIAKFPMTLTGYSEEDQKVEIDVKKWECVDEDGIQKIYEPVFGSGYAISGEIPLLFIHLEDEFEFVEGELDLGADYEAAIPNREDLQHAATEKYYRNTNLPVVRNQSPYGTCWSFANIGAIEADLIASKQADQTVDLSELQLAYFAMHNYSDPKGNHTGDSVKYSLFDGMDHYLNIGGNQFLASRYLTDMVGAAAETTVPYSMANQEKLDEKFAVSSNAVQVKAAYFINAKDIEGVKEAIKEHGGVSACMNASDGVKIEPDGTRYEMHYNEKTNAYYGNYPRSNHEIMLVGWDDSFAKENFTQGCRPAHDGAWIARNSWGKNSDCFSGYFYLSYEDEALINSNAVAYDADASVNDYCYSYASVPFEVSEIKVDKHGVAEQTFVISANETIESVGLELNGTDVNLTAEVSDGTTTASGKLKTSFEGYYTIKLDRPLTVRKDTEVTVRIIADCKYGGVEFLAEEPGKAVSKYVTYTAAKSGPGFTVNGTKYEKDLILRVYTNKAEPLPEAELYRMYNPNTGEHFFTANAKERDILKEAGWKYEGVAFHTYQTGEVPVYRLYNPVAGDHHYTTSEAEAENLKKAGWSQEGIAFYANKSGVAMYRLYNPNAETGAHHYTSSKEEKEMLEKAGWKYEGIGFYVTR